MCCIFTCCGWLIDLVQRLWTFTMSCCISSSVCCLLAVGSMSGIALGYNYSLAEYMDLKETNVSIYLKRGVFDDDLSELEWRRAGHIPARGYDEKAGLKGLEADVLEAGGTTVRSGRRLDDSVIDIGDQNRYEGSLFKLTAKPPVYVTPTPFVTPENGLDRIASMFTRGSLDSLKAIQNVIDARKAMAQHYGGTTVSPVPTYPFQEAERMYPGMMGGRRGMQHAINDYKASLNPARHAVPNENIGSRRNWMVPKYPNINLVSQDPRLMGFDPDRIATFPSPIILRTGPIRPTPTASTYPDEVMLLTRTKVFTLFSTAPSSATDSVVAIPEKQPTIESIKERMMMENEMPIRKIKPRPEEEYDYDIKGLPVRKRRSIELNKPVYLQDDNNLKTEINIKKDRTINLDTYSVENVYNILKPVSIKEVFASRNAGIIKSNYKNKLTNNNNINNEDKDVYEQAEEVRQLVFPKEKIQSDIEHKTITPNKLQISEGSSDLMTRLISNLKSFFELIPNNKLSTEANEVKIYNDIIDIDPKNKDTVKTKKISFGDFKRSDEILPPLNIYKNIMPSSILVNTLVSTIR